MDSKELIKTDITSDDIKGKIYTIRGVQVMLDSDLAYLYQVETFNLNKAVKRNIERFPLDFCFQLTKSEFENLKFQIGISNERGGRRYLPYVFTEQGVAMLSSVLHSNIAVNISIKIMKAFISIRHYLLEIGNTNILLFSHLEKIDAKLLEHDEKISQVFVELDRYRKKNEILFDSGTFYDAISHLEDIISSAKTSIILHLCSRALILVSSSICSVCFDNKKGWQAGRNLPPKKGENYEKHSKIFTYY